MIVGSPACMPQATLAEPIIVISSASLPMTNLP
jgi:hypothetical protein